MNYQTQVFHYQRCEDQNAAKPARHPVVIVGAGPVGLALAIDLAQRGQSVVVLDDDDRLSTGSRAICFAKRTLEIFDCLGIGDPAVAKGVSWSVGKVFLQSELVYSFNLQPDEGHERPAFINLQQYYVEGFLNDRANELPLIERRWKNRVVGVENGADGVTLTINTPDGDYTLIADYLVACDGARSPVRKLMGLESSGQVFRDRFLIADVKMTAPFPTERWFWFDPSFHPGQSVLLHKQPDDVWRIDFQLGWDADPEFEKRPENVLPRVRALLGEGVDFTLEWVSVYTFACSRMPKFRYGHTVFAGDAAHLVSPFGARGANSGVQDADNLGWKLAAVLDGEAPDTLLDSYAIEREAAADENILNSTRATDFLTPKSEISKLFRDVTLELAREHPFARRLVNSGRLSLPTRYLDSSLSTPDVDEWVGGVPPGAPPIDAPLAGGGWFLRHLRGEWTLAVVTAVHEIELCALDALGGVVPRETIVSPTWLARYFEASNDCVGSAYLFRPDGHVAARWKRYDAAAINAAYFRGRGHA